jgi:hypothetical protein
VVGQRADLLAEAVVGPLPGAFVQETRELAAQDLHLGGAAGGIVLARREGGDLRPVVVDEPQPQLAGPGLAGRVLEVHPAQDLPPGPRTSMFCPSSRSRGARSTTVVRHPCAFSSWARAGPAMLAPEISAWRVTHPGYPDR